MNQPPGSTSFQTVMSSLQEEAGETKPKAPRLFDPPDGESTANKRSNAQISQENLRDDVMNHSQKIEAMGKQLSDLSGMMLQQQSPPGLAANGSDSVAHLSQMMMSLQMQMMQLQMQNQSFALQQPSASSAQAVTPPAPSAKQKKVEPQLWALMKDVANKQEKIMFNHIKAGRKVGKLTSQIEKLADDVFPADMKEYKPDPNDQYLSKPANICKHQPAEWRIEFEQDLPRRVIIKRAALAFAKLVKQMELEAWEEHQNDTKTEASKEAFMEKMNAIDPPTPLLSKNGLDCIEFILRGPELKVEAEKLFEHKLSAINKALEKAEKEKEAKLKADAAKEKALEQAPVEQKFEEWLDTRVRTAVDGQMNPVVANLASLSPDQMEAGKKERKERIRQTHELLKEIRKEQGNATTSHEVDNKGAGKGKSKGKGKGNNMAPSASKGKGKSKGKHDHLPKNVSSPGGGRGYNQNLRSRGRGRGRGRGRRGGKSAW